MSLPPSVEISNFSDEDVDFIAPAENIKKVSSENLEGKGGGNGREDGFLIDMTSQIYLKYLTVIPNYLLLYIRSDVQLYLTNYQRRKL